MIGILVNVIRHSLIAQVCLAATLGLVAIKVNNAYQRRAGAKAVVVSINKQADALAKSAEQAREPAKAPGSADRLRRDYCRDC